MGAGAQRGRSGGHDHQGVLLPRQHVQPALVARAFDEAQVDLQPLHRRDHLGAVADAQVHVHVRLVRQQGSDPGGQQVIADGGAGPDPQLQRHPGGGSRTPCPGHRLQIRGRGQQPARRVQQGPALRIEDQAAADAVEQRRRQLRLQFVERRTGGRLRQRQLLAGGSGGAHVGDGHEYLPLAKADAHGAINP
ncbi:hypothetical protein D3C71_1570550 [compost metagenome]